MSAVADGGKELVRQQVLLRLVATSPGFTERYALNRLLGSSPEQAAFGAIAAGGLAGEHILATQGPDNDLNVVRARSGLRKLAATLAGLMEENLGRTVEHIRSEAAEATQH